MGPRAGLNGCIKSHPRQAGASVSRPTAHLLRVVMCATGLNSCLCGSLYSASQLANVSFQACVCVNAIHIHFCLVTCQPASQPGSHSKAR